MKNESCQLKANEVEKIDLSKFDESVLRQHMMKLMFCCGLYAAFRGCQEHVKFCISMVTFGHYPHDFETPELRGQRCVSISNFPSDKTRTLSVTNSYAREMGTHLRFPIFPDDPNDFGGCLERFVRKMAPGQQRMYCREGTEGYKKDMVRKGYPECEMYPTSYIGRTGLAALFAEGAEILGLPATFRPHSLRGACITKMVNDESVSLAETMHVARHTSVSASKTYHRVDGVSEGNRLRALGLLKKDGSSAAASMGGSVSSSGGTCPKSLIVEVDESGEPISDAESVSVSDKNSAPAEFPMTQVGIEELKEDIAELKTLMEPKTEVKKLSPNQKAIQELRGVVHKLKKELESREHDILYFRSLDHDNDIRVSGLREEVQRLQEQVQDLRRDNMRLKMENSEFQRYVFPYKYNQGDRRRKF